MIDEQQLAAEAGRGRPRHATGLLPALERAVGAAGGWERVELIAVGNGPGSFTGLRIGISTARALSAALGIPALGVPTPEALAAGARGRADGRKIMPVLDARRGEVFAALYGGDRTVLREPFLAGPEDLARCASRLDVAPLAVGSGALRFRQELSGLAEIPDDRDPAHRVAARHTCELGAAMPGPGPESLEPNYLRPPDAERWRERDTPSGAES